MKSKDCGFLISVEGIDGSGKSLFSQSLFQALKDKNAKTLLTREPGGTALSDKIRDLIFSKDTPPCKKTEFLLFAASRAQHFYQFVLPALENHHIVISDRMADSSLVYQGYVQELSLDIIHAINAWTMNNREPDIIFYLKVSPETAYKRIMQRNITLTCFEDNISVLEKAVLGFDTLVAQRKNVITLDGHQSPSYLISQALSYINPLIFCKQTP